MSWGALISVDKLLSLHPKVVGIISKDARPSGPRTLDGAL